MGPPASAHVNKNKQSTNSDTDGGAMQRHANRLLRCNRRNYKARIAYCDVSERCCCALSVAFSFVLFALLILFQRNGLLMLRLHEAEYQAIFRMLAFCVVIFNLNARSVLLKSRKNNCTSLFLHHILINCVLFEFSDCFPWEWTEGCVRSSPVAKSALAKIYYIGAENYGNKTVGRGKHRQLVVVYLFDDVTDTKTN